MLSLLPLLTFSTLFYCLKANRPTADWRKLILRSGVMLGAYAVLSVELLSLVHFVTRAWLVAIWAFPLFFLGMRIVFRVGQSSKIQVESRILALDRGEKLLWLGVILTLALTFLVAAITPPQTWDSLNYHMSRVAHWAQQRGIGHYATGIEVQNNMSPGAEILVLHSYVLSGGDQWVNLVQWLAMLGSLVGVAWLARQLGANRNAQLLTVVFAVSIPMGITEATSTMTDYVVAFWLICVASETLTILQGRGDRRSIPYLGLAVGLSILTKPTAYAFLIPFALVIFWSLLRHETMRKFASKTILVLGLILILNAGHFIRNQGLYSNPVGPPDRFDQHANQLISPRGVLSILVRNISLHIQTPSPYFNKAVALSVQWLHNGLGLDVNDPRTTATGRFKISTPRTNEILVGNPLHALLIMAVALGMLRKRKYFPGQQMTYAAIIALTAIVFSLAFKWLIFGSRLQLPFFLLSAPIVAIGLSTMTSPKFVKGIGLLLLFASLPWVLSIDSRPLLPSADNSVVGSVLTEPRSRLLFANGLYLLEPARDVVIRIKQADCNNVGLLLAGNGVEYPFWTMLNAPRKDLRMEWIVKDTPSEKLADKDFNPCAVICENCMLDDERFRGLPMVHARAPYRLYLKELGE